MSLSAIILFIIILLVLVLIHEFGHFIVAKWVGMRVDEFAFGFPPRLFAKKKGETTYVFNAIPLGGYVSILGENGQDATSGEDVGSQQANDHGKSDPRAFSNRPWWAQILVLIAGVTMNMLLAFVIFVGISYGSIEMSKDDSTYGALVTDTKLIVGDALPGSPAYKAGIIPGSILLSVSSNGVAAQLTTATSLIAFIEKNNNNVFAITYITPADITQKTTVAPVYGLVPDKKVLGIMVEEIGTYKASLIDAIIIGYHKTEIITSLTLDGLWSLVRSVVKGESVIDSLSGPVGIAKIVDKTEEYGVVPILTLVAILSINLAIFNVLPLPALDGGRIIVVLIETVFRRRIPYKQYAWINTVSFLLLILLVVVVTVKDFRM